MELGALQVIDRLITSNRAFKRKIYISGELWGSPTAAHLKFTNIDRADRAALSGYLPSSFGMLGAFLSALGCQTPDVGDKC